MRGACRIFVAAMLGLICSACSVTRKIPEGQYLLQKVKIDADKSTPRKERITAADFEKYVRQTPNKRFLGTNFYVWLYEQANPGKQNWWNNWKRRIGQEPVLLDMGLTEDELQPLVTMWRESNPNIAAYWWVVDEAVKTAIEMRIPQKVGCVCFEVHSGILFITLPSGRCLAYVKPRIGENKFGGKSVTYLGIDAQKKWSRIESYGPKFVENIVQAVSRDILAYAMRTLNHCFICGHVHDELIIQDCADRTMRHIRPG